jgi:hypothetical protein
MGRAVAMRLSVRRFPRRGLGQDPSEDSFTQANGITLAQYQADQSDSPDPVSYSQPASINPNTAVLLQSTPAILQGIAQVTKAANTPGIAYSGVGVPTTATTGPGVSLTGSSGWVVLIVSAVIGIAAFNKKG